MTGDELIARWDEQLARLAISTRTDFASLASEILSSGDGRSYLAERLRDPEFGEAAWSLAKWEVAERCKDGTSAWIGLTREWLAAGEASWHRSAQFCADVAWSARAARNSALLHLSRRDIPGTFHAPADVGLLHLFLQSQRYDYRFRSICEVIAGLAVPVEDLDPFSRAIYAFALLGQNADVGLVEFEEVRRLGSDHEKVAHALLHGLWFASHLPDQATRILELINSTPALRDNDATVALRKAYALRKLRRYDEASQSIDLGMLCLSPDAVDVHQDFVRERAMILVVREIEESYGRERQVLSDDAERHLRRAQSFVDEKVANIEDKVSDSLFKVVEILGLFTAVIALLVAGAASVTIGNLEWWQRALLMLTAGAVVMVFFFAIRLVVNPGRRPPQGSG